MRINTAAIFIALFYCAPALLSAQSQNVTVEKLPEWVTLVTFDGEANPPAGQETGFYYLLVDEQNNTVLEENYIHFAYKILTSDGIQGMSDITFSFDPTYQKARMHQIRVYRDGKIIDQLTNHIQLIRREQSMDRFLYDGSVTAVINLTDIRVGDIIEFAYSTKGHNPVYDGHVSRKIYFNFNVPFEKSYQRLVVPRPLSVDVEYRNVDLKPEIKTIGKHREYIWTLNETGAFIPDNNVPFWYDPYQYVMLTDFKDWAQVAGWATAHFAVTSTERKVLKDRLRETLTQEDDEAYALAAIRFVQDEIRYLGFESGLNSHKPHSPLKVFDQRFGDCKDKSLLLCEILRSRNIEASPVLVSTIWRDKLTNELPSINAFDHCVVQFKLNNQLYYVDPTINNQGGSLESNYFPTYGKGLVVNESTRDLIDLPLSEGPSDISEVQTITVPKLEGEAFMEVRTTYTGADADRARGEFLSNGLESIQKNYLTFYGNLYPDIEIAKPMTTEDHRNSNIFSVAEMYRIPTFWKTSEIDAAQIFSEVYPQTLENYFNVTKSSQRTAPYSLAYPVSYHHHIHVRLPEEWTVEPVDKLIETDYYQYEHLVRYAEKEISLQTHYATKADHIPIEAFEKFVGDHQLMMNNLSFQISYNKNLLNSATGVSWIGIVTALAALGFGLWLVLRLYYYYDPEPLSQDSESRPIGGWLILPAIGLVISPFRLIYDLFNLPEVYDSQMWSNLWILKRYGLLAFVFIEHIYNIIYLLFTILIGVLFFKRRSSLPRLISFYFAISCFVTTVDTLVGLQVDSSTQADANSYRAMISSIIAAAIWIPYFNMSTSVKQTFVARIGDDDDFPETGMAQAYQSASGERPQHQMP